MSESFHHQIRRILADRHGPEAAALFRTLHGIVDRRSRALVRSRYRDLLGEADVDEIVAEVLFALMEGALGRFRGESPAQLNAFVRTITDRTASRRVQRHVRERDTLSDLTTDRDATFARAPAPAPDTHAEIDAISPLDPADRAYLSDLVRAGSKAEMARRHDVSRAAVTQRIARIHSRIAALDPRARARHEVWMEQVAREALEAS